MLLNRLLTIGFLTLAFSTNLIHKNIITASGKYDLRKVRWGMTKQQVKRTEKNSPIEIKEPFLTPKWSTVEYEVEILQEQGNLIYAFINKRLALAVFGFVYQNSDAYQKAYSKIEKTLKNKYKLRRRSWEIKQGKKMWGMVGNLRKGSIVLIKACEGTTCRVIILYGPNKEKKNLKTMVELYTAQEKFYKEKERKKQREKEKMEEDKL